MPLSARSVATSNLSYIPGDNFELTICFAASPDLANADNVSIDLFRVDLVRNQFAFGFGAVPVVEGQVLKVQIKLDGSLNPGLYVVAGAVVCWGSERQHVISFDPVYFEIRQVGDAAVDANGLTVMVEEARESRQTHATACIRTPASMASGVCSEFRVLIAAVGCLVPAPQPLQGFRIFPLGCGFTYGRMLEIANHSLKAAGLKQLSFNAQTDLQHQQGTPTFAIDYWNVVGTDHNDALNHARDHAQLMFDLLGLDRGHKPQEFFCYGVCRSTGEAWHLFDTPNYRGNRLSPFNPVQSANLIESLMPKLELDPFLRLLLRSYSECTAEKDRGIALLRAWTVLELLADRAIPGQRKTDKAIAITHPDDKPIYKAGGVKLQKTTAIPARVYEFVKRAGAFEATHLDGSTGEEKCFIVGGDQSNPNYTPTTRLIPLWDIIRAAYAIRCRVAHKGHFSEDQIDHSDEDEVLAVDLIRNTPVSPFTWINQRAALAVQSEMNRP